MAHSDKGEASTTSTVPQCCTHKCKEPASVSEHVNYTPSLLESCKTGEEYRKAYFAAHSRNSTENPSTTLPPASSLSNFLPPKLHEHKSESEVDFPIAVSVNAEHGDGNTTFIENEDRDTTNTSISKRELHHVKNESSPFHDHPHAKSFKFPLPTSPTPSHHDATSADQEKHKMSRTVIDPHMDLPLTESPKFYISCLVPAALRAHTDPAPIDFEAKIEKMNASLRKLWDELEGAFHPHLDGNVNQKESDGGKTRLVGAGRGSANGVADKKVHVPSSSHIDSEPLQPPQLGKDLLTASFFGINSNVQIATALVVKTEPSTETPTATEETNINGLKSQISTLEKQNKDWVDLISHLEELLLSMDTEKSSLQSTISQLENERSKLQEQIHELEAKDSLFWIKHGGAELSLKTLSDDKAALESRLASLSAEKEDVDREAQELREKVSAVEKKNKELLEQELILKRERDKRQEDEAAQEERIEELECMVYDRGLEIDHLEAKIRGLEEDLATLGNENEDQVHEGGSEKTEINFGKVTNEIEKLVEIVTTMRAQSKETTTWLTEIKADLDAEESNFAGMQTLISSLSAQSLDLNAHLENQKKKDEEIFLLGEEKRKLEMLVRSFEGMVNTLRSEIEKQKSRVESLEGQNALLKSKSVFEEEKRVLSVQVEGLVAELENELGNTARLDDERKALEARTEELEFEMLAKKGLEENGELLAKIEDLNYELETKTALEDEKRELLIKIEDLEPKLKNLKEPYESEKQGLLKKISDLEYDLLVATKFDGELRNERNCDHSKKLVEYEEKISDLESDKERLENENELLEQDKSSLFSTIIALGKKLLESEREVGRRDITPPGQDGAMVLSGFASMSKAGSRIVSDSSTDSDSGLTRRMKNTALLVPESFKKSGDRVVSGRSNQSYATALCEESFGDDDMYGA